MSEVKVGLGIFVFKGDEFLMQRRQGAHGPRTWSVPGGHLEFGESFADGAAREVFEETNVRISDIKLGTITNDIFKKEEKHYVTIWMTSNYLSGDPCINEPDKCSALEWFTFNTLPKPLFLPWKQLFSTPYMITLLKRR